MIKLCKLQRCMGAIASGLAHHLFENMFSWVDALTTQSTDMLFVANLKGNFNAFFMVKTDILFRFCRR